MNRIRVLPAVVLVLALAGAGSANGQTSDLTTTEGMDEQDMVVGTVFAISSTSLVITTENGQTMTLAVDATVPKPASLKVGDPVRVEYSADPAGIFHASSVVLTVPSSPPPVTMQESSDAAAPAKETPPSADPYATSASDASSASSSGTLPATASPVPLVGSLGLLSLGAGFAWSALRRRTSRG